MGRKHMKQKRFGILFFAAVYIVIFAVLLGGCSQPKQQEITPADVAMSEAEVYDAEVYDAEVYDAEVYDAEVYDAEVYDAEVYDTEVYDTTYTETPTLPPVEMETEVYSFNYDGERANVISAKITDDNIEFFAELKNETVPIFTLIYNSQEGDIVTVLISESGEHVPVAVTMFEMPEDLSEEDEYSFIVAQEAVNEIIDSIQLK